MTTNNNYLHSMKKNIYYYLGFITLVAFVVFLLLSGADSVTLTGSVYPLLGLLGLPLLYGFSAVLIGSKAKTEKEIRTLRKLLGVSAIAVVVILLSYSSFIQGAFAFDELIKLSYCIVIGVVFCGRYLDQRSDDI